LLEAGFLFYTVSDVMADKKKNRSVLKAVGTCLTMVPLSVLPNIANAQATIIVSATEELNFGTITTGGAGGTVVIATAGGRTTTGTVVGVGGAGLESPGIVTIAASTGLAIDLSMTAPSYVVSNGTDTMIVNQFNLVTNGGGLNESVTLTTNPQSFNVGATLNVTASQAPGTYVGDYVISANYQ
jgi:hypothetical protein